MPAVSNNTVDPINVLNCGSTQQIALAQLLNPYGLNIQYVADNDAIPGSFFGEREAGLIGNKLYLRHDTPIHSALHEAGHYICMDPQRREKLDTDAEGDYDEENGVCYLQICFANCLTIITQERMMTDMDSWGYTFRLGSAKSWFEQDADDAKQWLIHYEIIDNNEHPTGQLRTTH